MARLEVGQKAPDFTLDTLGGGKVSLSEVLSKADKGVIVYFYPRAMTPGCTTQACDFRDSENSLKSAGYSVIGVSPDKVESLEKFTAKKNLNFPLASDPSKDVLEAWGAYGEKKKIWPYSSWCDSLYCCGCQRWYSLTRFLQREGNRARCTCPPGTGN